MNPKDQKTWEYFARFPFDVYNNWYDNMTLLPKYAPDGYLYDHDISDKDQVVYYNLSDKIVVWTVRGTDAFTPNYQDLYNDIKIIFHTTNDFIDSKYYRKWLKIVYKYKIKDKYKIIFASHSLGGTVQQGLLLHTFEHDLFAPNEIIGHGSVISEEALSAIYNKYKSYNVYNYVDYVFSYNPGSSPLVISAEFFYNKPQAQYFKLKRSNYIYLIEGDPISLWKGYGTDQFHNIVKVERKFALHDTGYVNIINIASNQLIKHSLDNFVPDDILLLYDPNIYIKDEMVKNQNKKKSGPTKYTVEQNLYILRDPTSSPSSKSYAKSRLLDQGISRAEIAKALNVAVEPEPMNAGAGYVFPHNPPMQFGTAHEPPVITSGPQLQSDSQMAHEIRQAIQQTVNQYDILGEQQKLNSFADLEKSLRLIMQRKKLEEQQARDEELKVYERVRKAPVMKQVTKRQPDGSLKKELVKTEPLKEDDQGVVKFTPDLGLKPRIYKEKVKPSEIGIKHPSDRKKGAKFIKKLDAEPSGTKKEKIKEPVKQLGGLLPQSVKTESTKMKVKAPKKTVKKLETTKPAYTIR